VVRDEEESDRYPTESCCSERALRSLIPLCHVNCRVLFTVGSHCHAAIGEESGMKLPGVLTRKTLLLPAILLIVVTAAGCGSEAGRSAAQSTPVAPGPTFQVIKVTVPPDISSTPGDSSEEKTEAVSKGGLRQFPEILKQSEGLTIGPVISSWQSYLDDGVVAFDDEEWSLCRGGRGNAVGEIFSGNIVWTLGPPTPGLNSNEIFLQAWEVTRDVGHRYVLSFRDSQPVLIPFDRDAPPGEQLSDREDEVQAFEVYELHFCTNTR